MDTFVKDEMAEAGIDALSPNMISSEYRMRARGRVRSPGKLA